MANADAAFGFRPVANDGGVFTGQSQRCVVLATQLTDLYVGAPVRMDTGAAATGGYQTVRLASLGIPVYGVVTSFEANPSSLEDQYRKSGTLRFAQIVRSDNALFAVQESGNIGLAGVGLNADFTTGTGSTVTGMSNTELSSGSVAVSSALDLQVVAGIDRDDNDLTASNAEWIVKFNDPQGKVIRTGT